MSTRLVLAVDSPNTRQVIESLRDDYTDVRTWPDSGDPGGRRAGMTVAIADAAALRRTAHAGGALRDWIGNHALPLLVLGDPHSWDDRRIAVRWSARRFLAQPLNSDDLKDALADLRIESLAKSARVLMVGPEGAATAHLSSVLAGAGIELRTEGQPERVFPSLHSFRPSVVVLLPGVVDAPVPELLAMIRSDAALDDIMVLAVHSEGASGLPAGTSYLPAPVAPQTLLLAVLDRARRQRALRSTQTLAALSSDHEQERLALDAHALVSIADARGQIVYANDRFCEVSGYRRDELLGQNHRLVKSGQHEARVYRELWRTISQGRIWQGELCNRRKDGRLYWVATTIMPIGSESGARRRYLSIRTDITALKQVQHSLRRQLRQQRALAALGRRLVACDRSTLVAMAPGVLRLVVRMLRAASASWFVGPALAPDAELAHWPSTAIRVAPASEATAAALTVSLQSLHAVVGHLVIAPGWRDQPWDDADSSFAHAVAGLLAGAWSRTAAELARQESDAVLASMLEAFPGIVAAASDDGVYEFVNERFATLFGLRPEQMIGMSQQGLLDASHLHEVRQRRERVLREGKPIQFEYRRCTPGSDEVRYFSIVHFATGGRGMRRRFFQVGVDITERTLAEERLLAREAELRSVLDAFPGWVARIDDDMRYTYVNAALLAWLGKPRHAVIGSRVGEHFGQQREDEVHALLPVLQRGEPLEQERHYRSADGKDLTMRVTLSAAADSSRPGGHVYYHLGVDITELREEQARLRELVQQVRVENAFRALMSEVATDLGSVDRASIDAKIGGALAKVAGFFGADRGALFLLVADHQSTSVAHRWCAEGVRAECVATQPFATAAMPWSRHQIFDLKAVIHIPDVADLPVAAAAEQALLRQEGVRAALVVPIRVDETVKGFIRFDVLRQSHRWPDSQIRGLDILGQLMAHALNRVEVEQTLRALKDEAEAASAAKSDFLANMSHELRTPMNAVLGFGQLLEVELVGDSAHLAYVREILKGGQLLLGLIDEVLDLARIESGNLNLSPERVVLAPLVDDCLRLVGPLADQRGISLNSAVDPGLAALGDRIRLQQVLMNLLSNAIKYNRERGRVDVATVCTPNGRLRILVHDTGPGIPAERQGELFQPFNRLGAEGGPVAGTGIGLAIVRRVVQMMHGQVGVESGVGTGTTFWVELPQLATDKDPVDSRPADFHESLFVSDPLIGARKILYVDDNPSNLRLVSTITKRWRDVQLLVAQDPELGVELAVAHQPDLVLLDIQMSPLDGFEVLEAIRRHAALAHVPVIAVTANAMQRDVQRMLDAGFSECLVKPLEIRQFVKVVGRALGLSHQTGR